MSNYRTKRRSQRAMNVANMRKAIARLDAEIETVINANPSRQADLTASRRGARIAKRVMFECIQNLWGLGAAKGGEKRDATTT